MNAYRVDLHLHTALSPCAADEMTPPAIVAEALHEGLSMIAICDHNAAGNVAAVQEAAGGRLTVIPGMEITTAEEVHILGFFRGAADAVRAAAEVKQTLPLCAAGDEERFGTQWLMDAHGTQRGTEPRLLAHSSQLPLDQAVHLIHRHGGVALAAHVNRPSFSVMRQLGFFPREVDWDGIELFSAPGFPMACSEFGVYGLPLLTSSDSHFLEDIGSSRTTLFAAAATFDELLLALRSAGGRSVRPEGYVHA